MVLNVLPCLQQIVVEPARELIRRLYLERIARAKGLDRAQQFVGRVIMPTPAAVLQAVQLLADGTTNQPGWGSVLCVDVGGATTDVHSTAPDIPHPGAVRRGLPEPYAMRTVEGDLGLRVSAPALLEFVGSERLRVWAPSVPSDCLPAAVQARADDVGFLPQGAEQVELDVAMARACVEVGAERHVGHLREHHLPTGFCYLQEGKDLTSVAHVIGTGGIFRMTQRARDILSGARSDAGHPFLLKPTQARLWIDRDYVMWAVGLLARYVPDVAFALLQRHLVEVT